ncbi:hypothetical protein DPMN_172727 [Dreissena polymorpha]|uniref:Uncharacterized protein n=1 Tax=Dreissena polymorpha TaxID=45954 RepID=A0A9D4IEW2_DREPO|nr:hypothetical protein DPMN_172727 [Dreissena polymorpha]
MTDMLTNKIQNDTEVEFEEFKRVEVEGKKKVKIVKSKKTKGEYYQTYTTAVPIFLTASF